MSAPAAIANAVADALGIDAIELPATPQRIWELLLKPSPLRLERPRSLEEALALLAEHGDDAKVIAGGQSLVPHAQLPARGARRCSSTSTSSPGSRRSRSPTASVRVGALCSQRDLERHAAALAACPLLALALPYVGHVATRNRGTVGGSIAHADAAAELPLLLQTLGRRGRGDRAGGRAPRARRTSSSSRT